MTCTNLGNMIVCTNPIGRLHVGNRYVWVDYHTHCGPSFSYDANGEKPYDPVDENDPVWPAFGAWLARFNVEHNRRELASVLVDGPVGPHGSGDD